MGHLGRHDDELYVLLRLGLRPGPRLVRERRRDPVERVLQHPVRVDVLWRDVGDQYWRLRRLAHGQRHGQLENQMGSGSVARERDGRRGNVRPHFNVGHIEGDGHV